MPSPALHIKPEDIDTAEKRAKWVISVVGCGEIGILHAWLFAEAGFRVICADTNQTVVNNIVRGKAPFLKRENELKLKTHVKTGRINATTDVKTTASQSDAIAVTIPVKVDGKKKADYSNIKNACKLVGTGLRQGSLVIVMSTTGVGGTEGVIKETLENTSGLKAEADFGLAYSPLEVLNEPTLETLASAERVVAAKDKNSVNAASTILGVIAKGGLKSIEDVKTAEALTLFKTVQEDVNTALANEFALLCEKAGIDYLEAHGRPPLQLPALARGNVHAEPYLLLEDAENLNVKLRIPIVARDINEQMVKHAINLTKDALRNCGKTLRRARVSLLGITRFANMKSSPTTTARNLAKMLEAKGAKVRLYDPHLSVDEIGEMQHNCARNLTEALEGTDCLMILTGHDQFKRLNLKKMKIVMKMPAAIIDFEGIIEPDKVEKEGFIYRGLGRGVWTK